ncbi:MAG TPA: hypothetical protein VFT12_08710 [Thermoanaerobaculia bacterium]|nr:hypothetical protein [Thermoanaerobaculia bacterium]
MTFRCRFCHKEFAWETSSYPFIWSRILVHLSECREASALSRDQRSIEARQATDRLTEHRPTLDEKRSGR